MNHISKFLIYHKKQNPMNSNKTPKLQRRLALKKNIDYDPPPPSDPATCHSLRTRSLDLPPPAATSFRIQGLDDNEFDLICQTLGLSGPDDFAIPAAAWEARKARSVSDLLPRLRHLEDDEDRERESDSLGNDPVLDLSSSRFKDSVRVCDEVIGSHPGPVVDDVASIRSVFKDNVSVLPPIIDDVDHCSTSIENTSSNIPMSIIENTSFNWDTTSDSTNHCSTSKGGIKGAMPSIIETTSSNWDIISEDSNGGGDLSKYAFVEGSIGGLKRVRPPLLAPPPSIAVRVIDDMSSTWDIMRSFAPDSEKTRSFARGGNSYSDDEDDREVRPRGSAAFLSESCSFTTTSNDDDSSSTTTEPMSNISPNGRFKRVITYWEKGELLGRGSFGTVYEGIADGGYFIAVKEVSLLDQGDMGRQSIYQLEQEIALLSQFEHENIVQYYGTDKDEAHLYIFLELVTKGSLLSLYQKYHLRDSQVSSYTRQILHGLKYLHERNVVHRDIKCANILVGADGSVKLADFGLAKATKLNDVKSCKGTAFWMAPEVVRGRHQGYGLPADIWSLGCTVLEMLTHRIPYSPLECMQALFRIGRGEPPPIPDSLSRDARDFISRCLKVDPNDRPTASQLLDHSFVKRQLSASSGSSSPYHSVGRGLNLS